ncbi:alpha-N-acetylglucosaminidase [Kitasatospora herbaricolor]|nr:alpha-N-acetylglucosaminidase [Kitasatospora herbaricolor]
MSPHPRRRLAVGVAATLTAVLTVVGTSMVSPVASAVEAPTPGPTATEEFDAAPAIASLKRLLPAATVAQFTFAPRSDDNSFTVSGTAGAITVQGANQRNLLAGVGWYLEHVAKVDIGWPGDSLAKLPTTLPAVGTPTTVSAVVPHRYALNDTDAGYSGPNRTFADYQHEIDLLALHGINEVFVQTGAEYPYYEMLQNRGYTSQELLDWIPGPAHQPWWLLQNLTGTGGPESAQLLQNRADEGRDICNLLRSLDMTPVLPGFIGTVPADFAGKEQNKGANVIDQGKWDGSPRPGWLDPNDPLFPTVAADYYRIQAQQFGNSTMYKMDMLHEGGQAGNVDVTKAAASVQRGLWAAHNGATWVILGWGDNPTTQVLNGIADKDNSALIVDGYSDRMRDFDRESGWQNTPYAFGTIHNFGGHTTIGANTNVWTAYFHSLLTKPNNKLRGIAYLPEATGGDPAAFELFTNLAWTSTPAGQTAAEIKQTDWFSDYATRRYGGYDSHATAAWQWLRRGPYGTPTGVATDKANSWDEPQDSLFSARPGLTVKKAAPFSPTDMRYNAATVQRALAELLQVAPALQNSTAYRYDLVNTARQALTNRSRVLLPRINDAYLKKDLEAFKSLTAEWNDDEKKLDALLASDENFLLGPLLAQARAAGTTEGEKDRLEVEQRSILTTWGSTAQQDEKLHDYGNRELAGLVSEVHAKRWSTYFKGLQDALQNNTGTPPDPNWFTFDTMWTTKPSTLTDPVAKATERAKYAVKVTGDPIDLATAINNSLPPAGPLGPITGKGGKCVDVAGANALNGTAVQLWDCNDSGAQIWSLDTDGSIRAYGKCMDAKGGRTTQGTVVQLYECQSPLVPAQIWTSGPNGSLINPVSGLCLDATKGSTANGTRLQLWECNKSTAQNWTKPS